MFPLIALPTPTASMSLYRPPNKVVPSDKYSSSSKLDPAKVTISNYPVFLFLNNNIPVAFNISLLISFQSDPGRI